MTNIHCVVFGMGYVGIPIAALLADVNGFRVTGVQRRSKRSGWKITVLNRGESPFKGKEPGLDDLISRVVKKGSFQVTDDPSIAKNADFILIDVQTPTDETHVPQYESLKSVSSQVGAYLKKGVTVIIESTVAPGTTENVVKPILEKKSGLVAGRDFYLAFSYERVMPGKLLDYIVNMPRVVGGITPESTNKAVWLYKHVVSKEISVTSCLSAELAKTIENSYRDINIAFANEMALVCESMHVNIYEIIELINARHDRHMHYPGAGVGGHCLPKDPWLLRYGVQTYGLGAIEPEFITLGRKINNYMPIHLGGLAKAALEKHEIMLKDATITVLGIAYLEDSDDTRNTPALPLIKYLDSYEANVKVHDYFVNSSLFEDWPVINDINLALEGSDCAIIVTKHEKYFNLDFDQLKQLMRTKIIIDGRNVYNREFVEEKGFFYVGIGKPNYL
ncbi:MAG: nucleotide sugar dehydrogenase [Candidatus Heimdallarchaeota archaeon]|nr:nucleotide sugar dehydrogenase [Candidatus Heimdallarchaeota archaeon]